MWLLQDFCGLDRCPLQLSSEFDATAVRDASRLLERGEPERIRGELEAELSVLGLASLEEARGVAHRDGIELRRKLHRTAI